MSQKQTPSAKASPATSKEAKATPQEKSKEASSTSRLGCQFGAAILIILTCLVLALAWLYWQQNTQINSLKTDLKQLQTGLAHAQDSVYQQTQSLKQQSQQMATIQQNTLGDSTQWVLGEIRYLIRLANFSLFYNNNLALTQQLLQVAYQELNQQTDLAFAPLKQAINQQLQVLKTTQPVDVEALLLQLSNASGQIPQLKLAIPRNAPSAEPPKADETSQQSSWQRAWQRTRDKLRSIVVVKYHDDPQETRQFASGRAYYDQHLQMLLNQAQWALLHQKSALYRYSLLQGSEWLRQYYAMDHSPSVDLEKALVTLAEINIRPPAIQLAAINSALQQLHGMVSLTESDPEDKVNNE